METNLNTTNYSTSNTRLLKPEEVAGLLNVSRSFAYSLMQTGQLPTVRMRSCVRVRQQDLDDYIQANMSSGNISR